jgi:hypothetical protein
MGSSNFVAKSRNYEFHSSSPSDLLKSRYGFIFNGTGDTSQKVSPDLESNTVGVTHKSNNRELFSGVNRVGAVGEEKGMRQGHIQYKKEVGMRFEFFRELVLKTREEFAAEAALPKQYIAQLEWGTVLPGILAFEYFYKEYGLNLTWLVTGEGDIFFRRGPRTPRYAYQLDRIMDYRDSEFIACFKAVRDTGFPRIKEDILVLMKQVKPEIEQTVKCHE